MSRHRAVRNLDIDDILDEDEYESEYDENHFDETEISNEDLDKLEDGLAYVYSVIGEDTILTATEIKEALWYYYFDREETINWTLEKIAKEKALEEKKKAKEEAKKVSTRPTKKVNMLWLLDTFKMFILLVSIMSDQNSNKKAMPSLSSLSNSRQSSSPANSLAQLRQNMQKPVTSSSSSLASLASSSSAEGKRPLSSLQALAQRSNTTAKTAPSLASLAVKSPSPTTTQKPLNSLAHLASRQSAPNSNAGVGKSALSSLAPKQSTATRPASMKPVSSPTPVVSAAPAANVDTNRLTNEESSSDEEQEEAIYENPLCAKPSAAAQFLFKPQQSLQFDPQSVFSQALKKPTSIHVFEFDQPSPDDIVIAAQNQRGGKKL
ncbi:uncharacterized protein ATC70_000359 [Mucor velutinosus]|uniref:HBS1-like protein N-terminal domain-containing protein n=1 Tax=Mucor velutinosus TaxID=708070 RepID=A0AAN7DL58_9FUNG|nr:hypothetical protein ATC70_000359 [Mucor velutinosus]